jgi:hypothetical protein
MVAARIRTFCAALVAFLAVALSSPAFARDDRFTIAVLPDTQNYLDYTHQRAQGFPFDASEMFLDQMKYIGDHVESAGGEIAFVISVGDVWQHQTLPIDPKHSARGFVRTTDPATDRNFAPSQVPGFEMPLAKKGYELIDGKVPFGVVPGNHDYDAAWPNKTRPREGSAAGPPISVHVGGLTNFTTIFGSRTPFFKGKPWYVGSHDGGADSAQIFTAGGYRFLHIGLQFDPPQASLQWAESMLRRYPGLPTIVSTHDYMDKDARRASSPSIDGNAVDPQDNSPQMLWDKLIRTHDQIFLVLCGHQIGESRRVDDNAKGHKVYQILADYQDRNQASKDAGLTGVAAAKLGDGWMRLMEFDFSAATPVVRVRTYSTHYKAFSTDAPQYAAWYKPTEKPELSDQDFLGEDQFTLELPDFRARFDKRAGKARPATTP